MFHSMESRGKPRLFFFIFARHHSSETLLIKRHHSSEILFIERHHSVKIPMRTNDYTSSAIRVLLICLAASATRILPHPVNFGPLTAVALFAGYRLGSWKAAIPVVLLSAFLSDLLVNALLYQVVEAQYFLSPVTLSIYGFYIAASVASARINLMKPRTLVASGLASSVMFFLISNGAVWATSTSYPSGLGGLMASYIAGIPFFPYTLMGDLFYLSILVLGTSWVEQKIPSFLPKTDRFQ